MAQRKTRNISIPPELDAKLDRFPDENWSSVACQAFEVRVKELEAMNEPSQEARAVKRLSASKMRAEDQLFRDGEAAGAKYVLHTAEYLELDRLARWWESLGYDPDNLADSIKCVTKAMAAEDGNEEEIEKSLRENHGDDIDDETWVRGFVKGALDKFEGLASQIE